MTDSTVTVEAVLFERMGIAYDWMPCHAVNNRTMDTRTQAIEKGKINLA